MSARSVGALLAALVAFAALPAAAGNRNPACGGEAERACCIAEEFPACDPGSNLKQLFVNYAPCPGAGNAGFCITDSTDPNDQKQCGGAGQRSCCVGESAIGQPCDDGTIRLPSATATCPGGAAGSADYCVAVTDCGGEGERACCITEGDNCDATPAGLSEQTSILDDFGATSGNATCDVPIGHRSTGSCVLNPPPAIGEPTTGWTSTPEPLPGALRGYLDMHLHLFGNLGAGGNVITGQPAPVDGSGAFTLDVGTYDVNTALSPDDDLAVHTSPSHGFFEDTVGAGLKDGARSQYGAPYFTGWPKWTSVTHQQTYYKWLERAWRGGLRAVTMFAVTNEALCKSANDLASFCEDSMAPILDQLDAAVDFERFIDEQSGGPGQGWFRIVTNPIEARTEVGKGNLAVVLGIEVDNLFNCKEAGCPADFGLPAARLAQMELPLALSGAPLPEQPTTLEEAVQVVHALGVRQVFPVHEFDNAFAAAATWQDVIGVAQAVSEGRWWQVEDCGDGKGDYGFWLSQELSLLVDLFGFGGANIYPFPSFPNGDPQTSGNPAYASCNARGLRKELQPGVPTADYGKRLLIELMKQGMLIDIDHMSRHSLDDTIALTKTAPASVATPYPLLASHALFFDLYEKEFIEPPDDTDPTKPHNRGRHERMRTAAQLQAIKDSGGMVAAMLKDEVQDGDLLGEKWNVPYTTPAVGSAVADDCRYSTKTWAQALQYSVDTMDAPVALSTDYGGYAGHLAPRFGSDACGGWDGSTSSPRALEREEQGKAAGRHCSNNDLLECTADADCGSGNTCLPMVGKVDYPFTLPGFGQFDRQVTGFKSFDYNVDGLAHIGLLPDMVEDLRQVGLDEHYITQLECSAEQYIRVWERAEAIAHGDPIPVYSEWLCQTQVPAACGDGVVDPSEECDLGSGSNGASDSCCTATCEIASAAQVCRAAAGGCDVADTCNGFSPLCPDVDAVKPAATVCRAAADPICDVQEVCDGVAKACPTNVVAPAGTPCRAADPLHGCDAADVCDGTNSFCIDRPLTSGTVCRAAADLCDAAEVCNGGSFDCPGDAFRPIGSLCRPSSGDTCDLAEYCTGSTIECPVDDPLLLCHASYYTLDPAGAFVSYPTDGDLAAGSNSTFLGYPELAGATGAEVSLAADGPNVYLLRYTTLFSFDADDDPANPDLTPEGTMASGQFNSIAADGTLFYMLDAAGSVYSYANLADLIANSPLANLGAPGGGVTGANNSIAADGTYFYRLDQAGSLHRYASAADLGTDTNGTTLCTSCAVGDGSGTALVASVPIPPAPPDLRVFSGLSALNTNAGSDAGEDEAPSLATDGAGRFVAVWSGNDDLGTTIGTDWDILVARSSDGGATWTDPTALSADAAADSGSDGAARVATTGDGLWVAVWQSDSDVNGYGTDLDILYARSTDDGATWSSALALNSSAPGAGVADSAPQLATDGAGHWVAVWRVASGASAGINVATSSDDAVTWSSQAVLNTDQPFDPATDDRPQVRTDGVGNWVVAWHKLGEDGTIGTGTDADVFAARSVDDGVTWSSSQLLNTNAQTDSGDDSDVGLATSGSGTWIAVWQSTDDLGATIGSDADILVARSVDGGVSWTAPAALNTNAAVDADQDLRPHVTTDGKGHWVVAWSVDNVTDTDVYTAYSTDDGVTWDDPQPLHTNADTDGTAFDDRAVVETDALGNWVGAWESDNDLGATIGVDKDILFTTSGVDYDGDGLADGTETLWGTNPVEPDTDGDGLTDGFEAANGFDPTVGGDDGLDPDGDGLTNLQEQAGGTNPTLADTDGDGLCDGSATVGACTGNEGAAGTSATLIDTDGDGLCDGSATVGACKGSEGAAGTNPTSADTDGDGLCDGSATVGACTGNEGAAGSEPTLEDSDGDGLCDGSTTVGACTGNEGAVGTDPTLEDSDGDGLCDGSATVGACWGNEGAAGTNPTLADTDGDGLCDGNVAVGICVSSEGSAGSDPNLWDTDGDGIGDGTEFITATAALLADTDGDGLCDGFNGVSGVCVSGEDLDNDGSIDPGESDPRVADTDGDGLSDGYEVITHGTDPTRVDSDGDGLSDLVETHTGTFVDGSDTGTDPNQPDSDQDGLDDRAEIRSSTVFVTSTSADGNAGGLAGADAICNGLAGPAGLGIEFRAWLSSSSEHARDRIEDAPYYRTDGVLVAKDLADLTDGTIAAPIDHNESNAPHYNYVGTGTGSDGLATANNCNDWTDGSGAFQGDAGHSTFADLRWTQLISGPCNSPGSLYCFELPTALGTDPNVIDTDGDGLSDLVETDTGTYLGVSDTGTDPLVVDTDGDGLADGVEVSAGTDPNDASDATVALAVDDAATVAEDDPATPIDVLQNDSDPDGTPVFTIASVTQPAGGTVVIDLDGLGLTYAPDPGSCNDGAPTDDFDYTLTPGGSVATVAVTVTCASQTPGIPALSLIGSALLITALTFIGARRLREGV